MTGDESFEHVDNEGNVLDSAPAEPRGSFSRKPRWSVCRGGYPNGWEPPLIETDDPREAVRVYAEATERRARMTTVAIFDDNGEGEPLDPELVDERLESEAARVGVRYWKRPT